MGWASVYDNPRGEGQLSSRDQKQVTEIGDQGPYEASWLLSSCRLQAVIGASSEIYMYLLNYKWLMLQGVMWDSSCRELLVIWGADLEKWPSFVL